MNIRVNSHKSWIGYIIIVLICFPSCARKRMGHTYTPQIVEEEATMPMGGISNLQDTDEIDTQEREVDTPDEDGIEMPVINNKVPNIILKRFAYTASYNKETRCPNWVAWKLTAGHTDGPFNRKDYRFHEDMDVPSPRSYYHDYSRNGIGLERGHMCPAGDNKWSDKAMDECHLLSNICPQYGDLNGGEWKYLEEDCRDWAKAYNCIYVVCGPIFYSKRHRTIGEDKISVPDAFFKVILRLGKHPQALGFIYPNRNCFRSKSNYVISVDEVEKVTGMDFFSALDDKLENNVECKSNLQLWE